MVKWIDEMKFMSDFSNLGAGKGGYREDHEFYVFRCPSDSAMQPGSVAYEAAPNHNRRAKVGYPDNVRRFADRWR